jgi:hypothetical protein
MKTLAMSYELQTQYSPDEALTQAARSICGSDLGDCIIGDIPLFQEEGLDKLSPTKKGLLITKYQAFTSPHAAEIVGWLKGEYSNT